jgi:hypothetical protein
MLDVFLNNDISASLLVLFFVNLLRLIINNMLISYINDIHDHMPSLMMMMNDDGSNQGGSQDPNLFNDLSSFSH